MTRRERAVQIGVSTQTLTTWEKNGVDVYDDECVRAKLSRMRNIPPTIKPEWTPAVAPAIPMPAGDDPTQIDIEAIISNLSLATDKHQASMVKIQIDGLLNAYKLREAAGKYVAKSTVEESLLRIGAVFKAALRRMEADLPPFLDGMDPPAMKEAIRSKVDEVLRTLDHEYGKVYGETDS